MSNYETGVVAGQLSTTALDKHAASDALIEAAKACGRRASSNALSAADTQFVAEAASDFATAADIIRNLEDR